MSFGTMSTQRGFDWDARFYRCDINNVRLEEITREVMEASVDTNLDRAVRMVASLMLNDAEVIDRFTDYVAPVITRYFPNGTQDERQLGLYTFEQPKRYIRWEATEGEWEGFDLTVKLANKTSGNEPYNVAASTNVVAEVGDLIEAAGITRYLIVPSVAVLSHDKTWPPGTSYLEIANDLLALINYYALFPDHLGRLTSRPIVAKEYATPWMVIDPEDIFAEIAEVPTTDRVRNIVTVRRLDPSQEPIAATARNDDPGSPWSTAVIGERPATFDDNEIEDVDAAMARAETLLALGGSYYTTLDLVLLPDPTIALHDVVDIRFVNERGTDLSGRYWVRTWGWNFRPDDSHLTMQVHRLTPVGSET